MSRILDLVATLYDTFKIGHLLLDCTRVTRDRTLVIPSRDGVIAVVEDLLPDSIMHVRHSLSSGTNGGTSSSGFNTRPLNEVTYNSIPGAVLSANQVTLPAGAYEVLGSAIQGGVALGQLRLYDVDNSQTLLVGVNAAPVTSGFAMANGLPAAICGHVVLPDTTTLELQHYLSAGTADIGFGRPQSSGFGEVYADLQFRRVADIPYMHVRHAETNGTTPTEDTLTGSITRPLNTVIGNTLAGASLSAGVLTLPAGEYEVLYVAPHYLISAQMRLFDVTHSETLIAGVSSTSPGAGQLQARGLVTGATGRIRLFEESDVELQLSTNSTGSVFGLPVSSGMGEVYGDVLIRKLPRAPSMHVQYTLTEGSNGGSSTAGVNTRPLNAVPRNTIAGASLASNQITLPAGIYDLVGSASQGTVAGQLRLYDPTNSVTLLTGLSTVSANASEQAAGLTANIVGRFELAKETTFELQHHTTELADIGLGRPATSGFSYGEVFANLEFRKIE